MAKNVAHIWKTIQIGRRFVYYNTLLKDDPILASKAQKALDKNAKSLIIDENENNSFSEILSFLKQAILFERKNEIAFFKQRILKNPIIKKYPKFYIELKKNIKEDNFDYINFITALNLALNGIDFYQKNLDHEKKRLDALKKNYEELYEKEGREKIQSLYLVNMDKLNKEYGSKILKDVENTLAGIEAEIFNEAINDIINSPVYKSKIIKIIEDSGYASFSSPETSVNKMIKELLSEPIARQIILKFSSHKDILSNLQNIYTDYYKKALSSLQFSKTVKENNSLKNATSYEVIRRAFSDRKIKEDQDTYLDELAKALLGKTDKKISPIDELQKIIESIDKAYSAKKTFTIFNNTYQILDSNTVQQVNPKTNKKIGKPKKFAAVLSAYKGIITKKINSNDKTLNLFKIIYSNMESISFSISRPDFAEYRGAVTVHIQTKGFVDGSANLKNDFILTVDPSALINKNLICKSFAKSFAEELIYDLNQTEKDLRALYKVGSSTDLTLSDQAFQQTIYSHIEKIEKELQQANLSSLEIEKEIKALLNNCFIIQGSVKDYENYNNEIGFIGGSLGSGGHIEALEKIYQMYEMGGITPIDKDWMYFAIVNSSSTSLGSHLKNPIQKYLSTAAALMMFSYGSSEMKQILEFYQKQFSKSSSIHFLNLYYVNGFYFPSSFILTLVLENITDCFTIIKDQADKKRTGVRIFNKSNPSWIDKDADPFDAEWSIIAKKTWSNIQIQFTFLAGLLDIVNELKEVKII